jgi:hypothetical protein
MPDSFGVARDGGVRWSGGVRDLRDGVSGAGKSSSARLLTQWGHEAVSLDADERLRGWHDEDGRRVNRGLINRPVEPDARWLAAHQWRWNPERLDEIITAAGRRGVETLWLYGHTANGVDLADRFDVSLMLDIDQQTMATRMLSPTRGNDYGRVGDALDAAVAGRTAFLAAWRRHCAVTVDAPQPLETVGQEVLLGAAGAPLHRTPRNAWQRR